MKVLSKLPLTILMVALLAACGNDNKSGRNTNANPWAANGVCASSYNCNLDQLNLDYRYNGVSIERVVQENLCVIGSTQRMQWQTTVQSQTVIQRNDVFVGVTSYGDVGMIIGNGTNTATFRAYFCVRQGQPMQVIPSPATGHMVGIGISTACRFKPLFSLTVSFSDGSIAAFRQLDGGTSANGKFSICY